MILDLANLPLFVRRVQIKRDKQLSGQWQDLSHTFTFLAAGSADFVIDGKRLRLTAGDAVLMPAYSRHIIVSDEADGPLIQYNVQFDFYRDPERAQLKFRDVWNERGSKVSPPQEDLLHGQLLFTSLGREEQRIIRWLFPTLNGEYMNQRPYSQEVLCGFLRCILAQFLRCIDAASGEQEMQETPSMYSNAWAHISKAIDYIGSHYSEVAMSNHDIAAAAGVSPVYLTMSFKRQLGVSLHRYLLNFRLEQAANLLISSTYSVTDIARLTGFSNVQTFSKAFRSSRGVSPREYVNTHVSKNYDAFSSSL